MNVLLQKVAQMCEERKCAKWHISDVEWDGAKEHQLIALIKECERQNIKPQNHNDWDSVLDESSNYKWMIQSNDTKCGTDINNNAPHSMGETPLKALQNAWKRWSIPPLLIMNADYFVKGISITDVL